MELLAPAGNYAAFLGAVNAGADAVYLGGQQFGARAYADNFTTEEIVRALHVAHFYGKKVYLTVNTLLKEREMASLYEYLAPFYEAGLDGVIVQDFGVFCYIREQFPGLPLHVSTQMTVTGARGAAYLKEQGAVRIVPARELSLEEVKKIRQEAGVEVECFIHGAMCYCYSGQCLFSSILGGRSGNRGRCAQPCRLPYEIYSGNKRLSGSSYPLSLKDMCTLAYLPTLLEAGIDSFKIEGRMKRPEYAAGVTAVYRKYIDLYYREGTGGYRVEPEDMDRLRRLYIRSEIQTGYYKRHNGKEMITLEKPGYEGCDEMLLAEIRETYLREPERMPVRMQAVVKEGEPLCLRVMTEACSALEAQRRSHAGDGAECVMPPEESGHDGAERSRTGTCPVTDGARAEMACLMAEVTGDTVQPAKNAPLSVEEVKKRLCQTGDSLLTVTDCEVSMEGACFVSVRALKELRRAAVEKSEAAVAESRGRSRRQGAVPYLENKLDIEKNLNRLSQSSINAAYEKSAVAKSAMAKAVAEDFGQTNPAAEKSALQKSGTANFAAEKNAFETPLGGNPAVDTTVRTLGQLRAVLSWGGCRRIYIDSDLFSESHAEIMEMAGEQTAGAMPAFYLALPYILRERDEAYLRRLAELSEQTGDFVRGFLVRSLEGLAWAQGICRERELFQKKNRGGAVYEIVPDAGLYCFNADALRFFQDFTAQITLPWELNAGEAGHLVRAAKERGMCVTLPVYSRIPMMITANCLHKTAGICSMEKGKKRQSALKDRLGNTFPVEINCEHCYNVIYNCVPYSLHSAKKERERVAADALRYDFTTEDGAQCAKVLAGEFPWKDYTTGHCTRGIQ